MYDGSTPAAVRGGHPETADAFGQALLAAAARDGQPATAYIITERDDGMISARDACHYFTPVGGDDIENDVLALARGRVLDIGCGAGRHARYLHSQGLNVLGIDVSAGAVEVCRQRGVTALLGNIYDPPPLGRFDTLLLLGGNLGLLGSPHLAPQLLASLTALAGDGAQILAEGFDPTATEDPDDLAYQRHNAALGMPPGAIVVRVRHRAIATASTPLWYLPAQELAQVLADSDWNIGRLWQRPDSPSFWIQLTRHTAAA
ncbi:class I SAM-dependent methyltransferase [Catellatospora methionotrophica]|uniref:class I SAM-dependent methyltransferase n=1 Tax=Catellatospora methionotrophica TaxID=121620 RepID=UPI0033F9B660